MIFISFFFLFGSLLQILGTPDSIVSRKTNYGRHEISYIIKKPYNTLFSFACTIIKQYMCYASLLYDTKSYHLGKIARKRKMPMLVWVVLIKNPLLRLFPWVFM